MADATADAETDEAPKARSLLLPGILLGVAAGGGMFYAVYSGLLLGPSDMEAGAPEPMAADLPPVAFIPLERLTISLGPRSPARFLLFTGSIEVEPAFAADVELLKPRILDVLNTYLRAVDAREFETPDSLARLRGHMLRRIQVVTGEGRVRDLLITEFVLN